MRLSVYLFIYSVITRCRQIETSPYYVSNLSLTIFTTRYDGYFSKMFLLFSLQVAYILQDWWLIYWYVLSSHSLIIFICVLLLYPVHQGQRGVLQQHSQLFRH